MSEATGSSSCMEDPPPQTDTIPAGDSFRKLPAEVCITIMKRCHSPLDIQSLISASPAMLACFRANRHQSLQTVAANLRYQLDLASSAILGLLSGPQDLGATALSFTPVLHSVASELELDSWPFPDETARWMKLGTSYLPGFLASQLRCVRQKYAESPKDIPRQKIRQVLDHEVDLQECDGSLAILCELEVLLRDSKEFLSQISSINPRHTQFACSMTHAVRLMLEGDGFESLDAFFLFDGYCNAFFHGRDPLFEDDMALEEQFLRICGITPDNGEPQDEFCAVLRSMTLGPHGYGLGTASLPTLHRDSCIPDETGPLKRRKRCTPEPYSKLWMVVRCPTPFLEKATLPLAWNVSRDMCADYALVHTRTRLDVNICTRHCSRVFGGGQSLH